MNDRERDPLAQMLQPLCGETWLAGEHREALLRDLEATSRRRSRFHLVWSALAGGLVAATLIAATGGARFLQRLFGLEIVEVERNAEGQVEHITVRTDEATTLLLKPWTDASELERPVIVTLPRSGGGEVRVAVRRDRDVDILPKYVPVEDTPRSGVQPGARYAVRQLPCPWTVTVTADKLTLRDAAGGRTRELPRVPTSPGTAARYGDDRCLLEVLDS